MQRLVDLTCRDRHLTQSESRHELSRTRHIAEPFHSMLCTMYCMQASYAMGYNLAVEYLADFEKTWMLESFKELDARVLQPQQRGLKEWLFLEV